MRPSLRLVLFLLTTVIGGSGAAFAQNADLTGVVKDASGAVLPGATVDAAVAGLSVTTTTTGSDGRYRLALAFGTLHQVRVRLNGFADDVFEIRPTAAASHDFTLRIAAVEDTVVVTATRVPERRSSTTESMTVFNAGDIQSLGSSSLGDVLRMVPGVNVESAGRDGALASLFARGGESDYNLVLVDGVRVNPSGGAVRLQPRVGVGEIDRLEVVKGGQSALYGSDAIASVVQVFTKRAAPGDAPSLTGSLEGGSFNSWRGDAAVFGGARRRVDYSLGAVYRSTQGAFQDILPDHDTFTQTSIDAGVGVILGDRAALRTGVRYGTAKGKAIGQIDYGSRDTGTAADTRDLSWHLDLSHRISDRVDQSATVNYFRSYRLSADTIADPTYNVYAILSGTPGAIFPASPRLVQLLDQATFNAYRSGAQPLAAGQFLATTPFGVSDFVSSSTSEFRRPAFRYQANATWGGDQLLSGGYDYERESDPLNPTFLIAEQRVLRAAAVPRAAIAGWRPSACGSITTRITATAPARSCRLAGFCCRTATRRFRP